MPPIRRGVDIFTLSGRAEGLQKPVLEVINTFVIWVISDSHRIRLIINRVGLVPELIKLEN
jgi:hypothetical protein